MSPWQSRRLKHTNMTSTLHYFAYGTPRDPEMMEAIIGREPEGVPGTLYDYQMVIQRAAEIPDRVRNILASNWTGEEVGQFETYAIRRNIGTRVVGMVWGITPEERELVDNWELNDGLWYRKTDVEVHTSDRVLAASTEMIDDTSLSVAEAVHPNLPLYLMDKRRMLEVARKVRENHLRQI